MTEPAAKVAYDALNLAKQNERDIGSHEKICAERYENIHTKLEEMKDGFEKQLGMVWKIIAWAGGSAFLIVMSLLGFLMKTQFDNLQALRSTTAARTELLERAQPVPPQVIIQRAPGTPDMGATVERSPSN